MYLIVTVNVCYNTSFYTISKVVQSHFNLEDSKSGKGGIVYNNYKYRERAP